MDNGVGVRCLWARAAMGIRMDWTGLMVVVGVVVVVVDFCQMGGLVTGGTVDGEMTNSGSTRQNGVSLTSGKVPLEKTLGLRSAWRG